MHQRLCSAYHPLMLRGTLVEGAWPQRPASPPLPRDRSARLLRLVALVLGKRRR